MPQTIVLFDTPKQWTRLHPLSLTRPISELRVGILTIREKWEQFLKMSASHFREDYLAAKYPMADVKEALFISGSVLPNQALVEEINNLESGQVLVKENEIIAAKLRMPKEIQNITSDSQIQSSVRFERINHPWDMFTQNGAEIIADIALMKLTSSMKGLTNSICIGKDIYVEAGAIVNASTLNSDSGPIYIGKGAEIMEGAHIRGPFALCAGSVVKMGAKIYGPTTIGPGSKVGGELNNVVIQANSNKAHDGFLGNSVIGEWCNLGADTNNSNLKNNYAEVRLWDYTTESFTKTGLQFCGLVMGDHSKCGINTMFNTGTVVGVSANIFGSGFPRNFVASFSWGGAAGFKEYEFSKALEVAEIVLQRRGKELNQIEKDILHNVYEFSNKFRRT